MKLFSICFIFLLNIYFSNKVYAQQIEVIDFKHLQQKILSKTDTTFVINFFASWCLPCLKELPDLVLFAEKNQHRKIKVIFVSLDFINNYHESLDSIIVKYRLPTPVYLLNESDANSWVNKINKKWSGAIPATLIFNNYIKTKKFIEGTLSTQKLNSIIQ